MEQESYLVMPFLDPSQSFTNGFECGKIWNDMETGKSFDKYLMHEANRQQVILMTKHFGYHYLFTQYDDTWCHLHSSPINISELL